MIEQVIVWGAFAMGAMCVLFNIKWLNETKDPIFILPWLISVLGTTYMFYLNVN